MDQQKSDLAVAVERYMRFYGWNLSKAAKECRIDKGAFSKLLNDPNFDVTTPTRDKLTRGFKLNDFTQIWKNPFLDLYTLDLISLVRAAMTVSESTPEQLSKLTGVPESVLNNILSNPSYRPDPQLEFVVRVSCSRVLELRPGRIPNSMQSEDRFDQVARIEETSNVHDETSTHGDSENLISAFKRAFPDNHYYAQIAQLFVRNPAKDLTLVVDDPEANIRGLKITAFKREMIKWVLGERDTHPNPNEFGS